MLSSALCFLRPVSGLTESNKLSSLGSFLGAHNITPLYTTGFCENECLYEGYFEIDTLKMPLEEFKEYFTSLPGISNVKIVHFKI